MINRIIELNRSHFDKLKNLNSPLSQMIRH